MNNMMKYVLVALTLFVSIVSCKKESFEEPVTNTFTLENIADTILYGKQIPINIIKTKDIKQLELSIASLSDSKVVLKDTLTDTADSYLMSASIEVPADGSWAGDYVVTLAIPNSSLVRTDTVFFKKGIDNYYLVGGSSSAGWEPTTGILFNYFTGSSNFYELYGYFTNAGDGLKVLPTNVNWDGGFGMISAGLLSTDGSAGNIPVASNGFYRMRLDMTDLTKPSYMLVASKWGIIGDATAKGWDASSPMTSPTSKGAYSWTITTALSVGTFKFRENDAWDVNLGADGSGSALKYDGDNINISAAGNYQITLNLTPGGYTYSLQKM